MAKHVYTYDNPPSERDLAMVCDVLRRDGIVAYPTDVNWAFGCDAASVKAIERIRRLKPTHPKEQPFALLCSSISMASSVGVVEGPAYRWLKKLWPGPYTVLLTRQKSLPRQIKDKRPVVGVRVPDSPLLLALIERLGQPLATTSVPMREDGTPYRCGYEVEAEFGHALDVVLDLGGELPGLETTVLDFTTPEPVLIRAGVGPWDDGEAL